MDIDNSFFMTKFDVEEDTNKVMEGGQWMIFDHYLLDCFWSPIFVSSLPKIDKIKLWRG